MNVSAESISVDRLEWMDCAKGIAIILMVMGHTSIPQFASDFIWGFHLPLFFIASGWLTNWERDSRKDYLLRKARNLLIPFLSYSIIALLCFSLLLDDQGKTVVHVLENGWEGIALWFIPVLFVALQLAKWAIYSHKDSFTILFALSMAFLGSALSYFSISLPWAITSIPYATSLVILGMFAKRYVNCLSYNCLTIMIVGAILTTVISHFYRLDIASNQVFPVTLKTLGAVGGTAMIFAFSQLVCSRKNILSLALVRVGKETLMILALSQVIMLLLIEYTGFGSVVRYALLIVILSLLCCLKDFINRFATMKLL